MEVGTDEILCHHAFVRILEGIAVAEQDTTERLGDAVGLATVVFEADEFDGLAVQLSFDNDIADAALAFIGGGFGVISEEVEALDEMILGVFVALAEKLETAADSEEENAVLVGGFDLFSIFDDIVSHNFLLFVGAATEKN